MFYRNLTLFRFPADAVRPSLEDVEAVLAEAALKPVGALELRSEGFVSPLGRGETQLAHRVADALQLALGSQTRLLPSAVINDALAERIEKIKQDEGRSPGGRERRRLKDEIVTDLIPRSFVRQGRLLGFLDLAEGWCVVDSSSRKAAEGFVSAIRSALGSFPAVPVSAASSVRATLTAWIDGEPLPAGFALGDEVELRDPVDSGAVVRARRQELDSEEVREHLRCGKQAFQVALVFEDRISFVLGEDLVIRKLKYLESVTETLEADDRESARDEADAVFVLQAAEVRRLLAALADALAIEAVT